MLSNPSYKRNLSLIGMPSCGKSTLGHYVANHSHLQFIDTDKLIEQDQGMPLQAVVDQKGWKTLREIEAAVICELDLEGHVIATGGSAVYSTAAMHHLRSMGELVFLDISLSDMLNRLGDVSARGLARPEDQSLEALYHERHHLYLESCSSRLQCGGKGVADIGERLLAIYHQQSK